MIFRVARRFKATLAARGASLTVRPISNPAVEGHPTYGHATKSTLLKLSAVADLVGDYDRVIYLDSDVLVFDLGLDGIQLGELL